MQKSNYIVHVSAVPEEEGHYPPPFDTERLAYGRNLGKAVGTVNIGLWQERVPPGRRTSFTHAHSHEEELVYILSGSGHMRIVEPGGASQEIPVEAGQVIGFPAGTGIAHCFVNRGTADATLLCFGERRPQDRCFYAEDVEYDAHFKATRPEKYWSRNK